MILQENYICYILYNNEQTLCSSSFMINMYWLYIYIFYRKNTRSWKHSLQNVLLQLLIC